MFAKFVEWLVARGQVLHNTIQEWIFYGITYLNITSEISTVVYYYEITNGWIPLRHMLLFGGMYVSICASIFAIRTLLKFVPFLG